MRLTEGEHFGLLIVGDHFALHVRAETCDTLDGATDGRRHEIAAIVRIGDLLGDVTLRTTAAAAVVAVRGRCVASGSCYGAARRRRRGLDCRSCSVTIIVISLICIDSDGKYLFVCCYCCYLRRLHSISLSFCETFLS